MSHLLSFIFLLTFAVGVTAVEKGNLNKKDNLRKLKTEQQITLEHTENFAKYLKESHSNTAGVFGLHSLIDPSTALQSAPESSSSTSNNYIQFLGRKKSNCDGDSEVMTGSSMLLNTCFFIGQFYSISSQIPYYAKIVSDSATGIYFNATYSLASDCSTTLSTFLLPYPEGCSKVSGDSLVKSMKVAVVNTIYWPTGEAYAVQ